MDIRVIIAGGRKFDDYEKLSSSMDSWFKLKKFKKDDIITIVCGCADGADLLGKRYAEEKGYKVELMPANWKILGKCAGILRNGEMAKFAESGDKGFLVVFWDGKSRGTKNMIDTAIQHKLPVQIFSYDDTTDIITEYIGNISDMFDSFSNIVLGDKNSDTNLTEGIAESDKISIAIRRI